MFSVSRLLVSLKDAYLLRSETVFLSETMAPSEENLRHLASLLQTVFGELGDYEFRRGARHDDGADFRMISTQGHEFAFNARVRERVTSQMADDLFARIRAT